MTIQESITKIKESAKANFDESIEVHVNLNIDVTKTPIRVTAELPNGTGKEVKLAVIAVDYDAKLEKTFSDVTFGGEELIEKIAKGKEKTNFDTIISTPATMPKLAVAARILGPQGLMPNPKSGTVVDAKDIKKTINTFKKGKVEVRTQADFPVIHTIIGKVSFENDKLAENFEEIIATVKANKPPKAKMDWIKSVYVCSTMGKGFAVEI